MGVAPTILEIMGSNVLQWYGCVLRMGDNRWPKRILTCGRQN
jgi:hypothetical protein